MVQYQPVMSIASQVSQYASVKHTEKASSIYSPSLEVKNKRAVLGLVDEVQSEEEVIVARSFIPDGP